MRTDSKECRIRGSRQKEEQRVRGIEPQFGPRPSQETISPMWKDIVEHVCTRSDVMTKL